MTTRTKEDIALIAHLLRRAGFGAAYDELESSAARGYEATVEELLHPESQPSVEEDLLYRLNPGWRERPSHEQNQAYWVYRMINSKRQLEEKITLFWHGVHCTGYAKVDFGRQMGVTLDVFRRFGLGSFRDLLIQFSKDPGNIYHLDNNMNHKGAINENWGRELLELFTMGVGMDGHPNYTEDDIKEVARAFTGWTISPTFPPFPYGRVDWQFLYDPTDHDDGEKVFLGHRGRFNGEDIIDIICQQPATARFISRHLYDFFVADEGPAPRWADTPPRDMKAIETLSKTYFESNYDIRSMLRVMFNSDFFKNARFARVKAPAEVAVGTIRLMKSFALPTPGFCDMLYVTRYMGQDLLNPPTVEGWHMGKEWIDSGTLAERINFVADQLGDVSNPSVREMAERLSARAESLTPEEFVDGCLDQLGSVIVFDETRSVLIEHAERGGEIRTGCEQFTCRMAEMLQLIGATAEYQLC